MIFEYEKVSRIFPLSAERSLESEGDVNFRFAQPSTVKLKLSSDLLRVF